MNGYGKKDEREPIRRDPLRLRLKEFLRRGDLTLAAASPAIGRNRTCLQQYVDRGVHAVPDSAIARPWPNSSGATLRNCARDRAETQAHEAQAAPAGAMERGGPANVPASPLAFGGLRTL